MGRQKRLNHLLSLYAQNQCSREEFDELLSMVSDDNSTEELMEGLKPVYDGSDDKPSHTTAEWDLLYNSIMHENRSRPGVFSIFKKFAIAAAILIISLSAFLLYHSQNDLQPLTAASKIKPVIELEPGGNNAVLTLSDGKKILLNSKDNGLIANQFGVSIFKADDGQLVYNINQGTTKKGEAPQFNTIETPRGGQYMVTMPDGSKVWLNAMSSLRYPVNFGGTERHVELRGEGYFEVAKNENMPFRVKTSGQTVEVLGTHFNINAYANEKNIRTTLIEGSVKVLSDQEVAQAKLEPGEQSILSSGKLAVRQVDTELAVAWKNGYFIFNKSSLESIMREISRWYDIDVEYKNQSARDRLFSGTVSRFENASQVLDILELTGVIHFKVEGRRIIVM